MCLTAANPCILCMETIMLLSSSTLQYSSLFAGTGHIIQVNGHSGRALAKGRSAKGYSICVHVQHIIVYIIFQRDHNLITDVILATYVYNITYISLFNMQLYKTNGLGKGVDRGHASWDE